jgi:hypothetical protein
MADDERHQQQLNQQLDCQQRQQRQRSLGHVGGNAMSNSPTIQKAPHQGNTGDAAPKMGARAQTTEPVARMMSMKRS